MGDEQNNHEFRHPSGLTIQVPKGFSLNQHGQDVELLLHGTRWTPPESMVESINFPYLYLGDLYNWLLALDWAESGAVTPTSDDWPRFVELVSGKEGINLRPSKQRPHVAHAYSCVHRNLDRVSAILEKHFGVDAMHETLAYLARVGATCDCSIVFIVDGITTAGWRHLVSEQLRKETDES